MSSLSLVVEGWQSRLSANEWCGMMAKLWASKAENSHFDWKTESSELCKFIVTRSLVGPVPSSLLLEYLQQGVKSYLFSPLTLIETISTHIKLSPSNGRRFESYINLLRNVRSELFGEQQQFEGIEGCKLAIQLCHILVEGIRYYTDVIRCSVSEGIQDINQQIDSNTFSTCVNLLRDMFASERTLALLLIGKEELVGLWSTFEDILSELKDLFHSKHPISPEISYRMAWYQLKDCLRIIKESMHPIQQNPTLTAGRVLDLSLYNQPLRSWVSLCFILEEEFSGRLSMSVEQAARCYNELRIAKGKTFRYLYSELLMTTWHSFYNTEPESHKVAIKKNYLLVKLPSMIEIWKEEDSDISLDQDVYNNVELSILDFAKSSSLACNSEIFDTILRVCVLRGCCSAIRLKKLFPQKDIENITGISLSELAFDPIAEGAISKTLEDVQALTDCIEKASEKSFVTIINCLVQSITSQWTIQDPLVQLLMKILSPDRRLPVVLVDIAISAMCANKLVLDIIYMQGQLDVLIEHVLYWLDLWGSQVGSLIHEYFGSAMLLMIIIFEGFPEIKIMENYSKKDDLSQSFIRWYNGWVNLVFYESNETEISDQILLSLFQEDSNKDSAVETFTTTLCPWSMVESVTYVLDQCCNAVVYGRLDLAILIEGMVTLSTQVPYWAFSMIHWLCGELETSSYRPTNQLDKPNVFFQLLIALLDAEALRQVTWSNYPMYRVSIILSQFQKMKFQPERLTTLLEKIPKQQISMYNHSGVNMANLSLTLTKYFTALMSDTTSLDSACNHFKCVYDAFGKDRFCSMILKLILSNMSDKNTDGTKAIALRAAELGGCILGNLGRETVLHLFFSVIPNSVTTIETSMQGQIMAYFMFYAGLRAKIFNSSGEQMLDPVGKLVETLESMLVGEAVQVTPKLSFPLTMISLLTSLPFKIITPQRFLPLLKPIPNKFVNRLSIINFSDSIEREFCLQYFSQ